MLVMDNLNTHHPASLYEAFEPSEARRIAERLEIHYTPKHGSWLNMAEIEIGVAGTGNAWTDASPAGESWSRKPGHGNTGGIGRAFGWTGASPPQTPASSSNPYTHHYKDFGLLVVRNLCNDGLIGTGPFPGHTGLYGDYRRAIWHSTPVISRMLVY